MTAHYRKELSFSFESLDAASVAYKKLTDFANQHKTTHGEINKDYFKKAHNALCDDLGTPEVIAIMWGLVKDNTLATEDIYVTLIAISNLLGLNLDTEQKQEAITIPEEVEILLQKRKESRAAKDFQESDKLRKEIERHGYAVKDTNDGQKIEKI
jgi:cysteinyl-tRNA synthetase